MDEAERELTAWRVLLDDHDYRLEHPEDYRATLYQRAEELRLRGLIDWMGWFELKEWADAAYSHGVEEGITWGEHEKPGARPGFSISIRLHR